MEGFIEFFITNLNYDLESGRESAISILHSIVKRFPPKYLNRQAALMFIACGSRLINDESAECREHVAECLETLLARIDANQRDELFTMILTLLNDNKSSHREMAALLCTRFINAEKHKFAARLEKVLSVLITTLCSGSIGKFVRSINGCGLNEDDSGEDENGNDSEDDTDEVQRTVDHQTIQLQNTILKILGTFNSVFDDYPQYIDELAYESQKLLAYEHTWVRLNALKTLQLIIQNIDVDIVHSNFMTNKRKETQSSYIYGNPEQEIKSLILDLCAQLIPNETDTEMANEVTTVLLLIANLLKDIPFESNADADADDNENDNEDEPKAVISKRRINLPWLLRRLRYVVHAEVAKTPQSTILVSRRIMFVLCSQFEF